MEKSSYEQMDGTYRETGDYVLLNLTLPEKEERPIGVWTKTATILKTAP